ncbi:MAG: Gfo/Idh/MocA family oxidoreductase [bacterium]
MADRTLGVGFVGIGKWAGIIARGIEATPGIETAACYTRTREKREDFAREFGCEAVGSYADLLAHPRVEAVAVLSTTEAHHELALAAIEAGKHLFIDKPITVTIAQGAEIVRRCAEAGLTLQVGYETRCMSGIVHLKRLLDEGKLGQPVACEVNWSHDLGMRITPDDWYYYEEKCPGGPLMQMGIHHVNNASLLMGPVARVRAMGTRQVIEAEVPDLTGAILEHESGALTYLGAYYHCPRRWNLDLMCTEAYASLVLHASQGDLPEYMRRLLDADAYSELQISWRGGGEAETVDLPRGNVIEAEMAEFARRVGEGGPSPADGAAGVESLAVVHAAVESMKSGRAVEMKEFLAAAGG